MRNMRMGTRIRVSICVIIPALGLWVSALGPAHAEPSAECRDLAARFATAAAALDLPSLAGLMTCVSAEIQDRAGGTGPAPPPRSPEGADAPASASAHTRARPVAATGAVGRGMASGSALGSMNRSRGTRTTGSVFPVPDHRGDVPARGDV